MKNHKTLLVTGAAIAAVLIMIVFAVQSSGNKAIGYEESVETAKADVDTQLQRRYNVLTELAECVKQ